MCGQTSRPWYTDFSSSQNGLACQCRVIRLATKTFSHKGKLAAMLYQVQKSQSVSSYRGRFLLPVVKTRLDQSYPVYRWGESADVRQMETVEHAHPSKLDPTRWNPIIQHQSSSDGPRATFACPLGVTKPWVPELRRPCPYRRSYFACLTDDHHKLVGSITKCNMEFCTSTLGYHCERE